MSVTDTPAAAATARPGLAGWGWTAIVLGLLAAVQHVATVAWPAQVSDAQYSYPFTPHGHMAAMVLFAVGQLGLLAGIGGIARLAWARASRATRAGLLVGVIATILLMAIAVIAAITAAHAAADSAQAEAIDSAYGAPTIAIGIGLVIAGIGLARRPVLPGPGRWIVLAIGSYVFVPMLPALFDPNVLGRLALGLWMLLVAVLGLILVRAGRVAA